MENISFLSDFSPIITLLCIIAGLAYAYLLYSRKPLWGRLANIVLFSLRALLVTLIVILFIGMSIRSTVTKKEQPTFVVLLDNSISVRAVVDLDTWKNFYDSLEHTIRHIREQGFKVDVQTFDGALNDTVQFIHPASNLYGASQRIVEQYEGKNLVGLVVVSDGLYNSGISPLYTPFKVPVYTIGIGDTIKHADVRIKNITCNKIALKGNRFPLSVELLAQEIHDEHVEVYVYRQGKLVANAKKYIGSQSLIEFDFELEAPQTGLQRIDVLVSSLPQERNTQNNRDNVYIDVVESKRKFFLISSAPHPDNKAISAAIAAETNYELIRYISETHMPPLSWTGKNKPDLVIFRYAAHEHKINHLLDSAKKHHIPLFVMLGGNIDVQRWNRANPGVELMRAPDVEDVRPTANLLYDRFTLPRNINDILSYYPPAQTFFRIMSYPPNTDVLLWAQRSGEEKDQPLLFSFFEGDQAIVVLCAENIWKWRLSEFARSKTTSGFDLVFSKLIRYLGVWKNKEDFRIFPIKNEFIVAEPIVFETQAYNRLFERVYGYPVTLELTDSQGKVQSYRYVLRQGQSRYIVGMLEEGIYTYRASTVLNGRQKIKAGEFRVLAQDIELQDLHADFTLLRDWSDRTGGVFYTTTHITQLGHDLADVEADDLVHRQIQVKPLIDLKWLFLLLLLLVVTEWFSRKLLGGY